jgi:hypothetical protein
MKVFNLVSPLGFSHGLPLIGCLHRIYRGEDARLHAVALLRIAESLPVVWLAVDALATAGNYVPSALALSHALLLAIRFGLAV